jgi:hypothetical protein
VISQTVVLGAVHMQDTQFAFDQVSFTWWQAPSSKHPVSEQASARDWLDAVVVGMAVVVVNIRQCGTSPHLTCPCTQAHVLQSIAWPVGVSSLNFSPDVKVLPPCVQVHSIFLLHRSTASPDCETSGAYVAGQVHVFSWMVM